MEGMLMEEVLDKLRLKQDLEPDEAGRAMREIMSGKASHDQIISFLTGLREKGESIGEIAAFTRVLRDFSVKVKPDVSSPIVDTCGAGGDNMNTFNISTTAAFVVAGAGVPVAKHGNRSVSSKSGSADVLQKLGVNIEAGPERVAECIEKVGIGFMFAPLHHTAMRHVADARRELGVRTVFNILGPLISPAEVRHQLYGIFDASLTEKLAGVLKELGSEHAMVVHGMKGMDELSTLAKSKVSELEGGRIRTYYTTPREFGLKTAALRDIEGGGPKENARITLDVLGGKEGPRRDIVLLNAGAAIYVADSVDSIREGMSMAQESIDSGRAMRKLEGLVKMSNEPEEIPSEGG